MTEIQQTINQVMVFHGDHPNYTIIDKVIKPKFKFGYKVDIAILAVHKRTSRVMYYMSAGSHEVSISNSLLSDMPENSQQTFRNLIDRSLATVEPCVSRNGYHEQVLSAVPTNGSFALIFDGKVYKTNRSGNKFLYAILTSEEDEQQTRIFSAFWSKHKGIKDPNDSRLPYKLNTITSKIKIVQL